MWPKKIPLKVPMYKEKYGRFFFCKSAEKKATIPAPKQADEETSRKCSKAPCRDISHCRV